MSKKNKHVEIREWQLNIIFRRASQWRVKSKKYNIQNEIEMILGKECDMKNLMRFLRKTEMYEEIKQSGKTEK